jgi:hypothetical protein
MNSWVQQQALEYFKPLDNRPIWEWAKGAIDLQGDYAITGRFDVSISRHMVEPFRALQDDCTRSVTVLKPVRGGGSLLFDVWIPWVITHDPGPIMMNFQKEEIAKHYAERRTWPVFRNCPEVMELLKGPGVKDNTRDIVFGNGCSMVIQGNAPANLQTKGIRYQVNDEIWLWPHGRHKEALGRLGDFEDQELSKVLNVSQAGVVDDDLDLLWQRGTMEEWMIPCTHCGHHQYPGFGAQRDDGSRWGIRWDRFEGPLSETIGRILGTIRFECEKCGQAMLCSPQTKTAWNEGGWYEPKNGAAGMAVHSRSFHWSSVITRKWTLLVEEFLEAKAAFRNGLFEPLNQFFQKRLAEPADQARHFQKLEVKTGDYAETWKEEETRFLTVDVQADGLFYCVARAWGATEARAIWIGKLFGFGDIVEKQKELGIPPQGVLIDSGYDTLRVYEACARFGWLAVRGTDRPGFAHVIKQKGGFSFTLQRPFSELIPVDPVRGRQRSGMVRGLAAMMKFSSDKLKDILVQLRRSDQFKWLIHEKMDDEDRKDYLAQLSAEAKRPRVNQRTGRSEWQWIQIRKDNHYFDCETIQILAALVFEVLPSEFSGVDTLDRAVEKEKPPESGRSE